MDEFNENGGVTNGINGLPDPYEGQKIVNVEINREMKKSYLDYSMSVIIARALPDVRDGLKPVHRRILYTMYENGLAPEKAYRKCADTVGSVLGRYHPHGDASVYDAMVRLAQDFSMRYMLVDGHGNFGSVDGDPPAAYRYTESRMSKISTEMLTDIEKNTVDFMPNYDDRLKEPTVLPSRFPNLLVNGSSGIAVGMATNIPPHNMREVIDGICYLIDNPDAELDDLMEYIKGPDFPTAGIIMGRSGIRSAYGTGRGKIILRAQTEIIEEKGRYKIIVTELPYQVNKARLIEAIADLVKDKRIEDISDINDYSSDRTGMHIEITLKRDANPQVVLNKLFTFTQLQITFGAIMLTIVNGEPKILTLKEILTYYLDFQCEVIVRRTEYDLKKAREREHILKGLLIALDYIDEVIRILRESPDQPTGKARLMERFGLDDIQAQAIVQMRLGQLTGLEREKIEDEMAAITAKIAEYTEILGSHEKVLELVKTEVGALRDKYGDDRRTRIENISGEVDVEDLIPNETCMFTYTTLGYIKRQPIDEYKTQNRGGRGIKGMTRREEDIAETMFLCDTHDYVMFFTSNGKAYKLKGYEIPEGSRNSKGMNIVNLLPLEAGEKISAMIRVPELDADAYVCMVTCKGIIKRTELSAYRNLRKNGIIAINLDDDDELAWVKLTEGNQDLLIATKLGMCIRFNENGARSMGRTAHGVRAIRLLNGDRVVGFDVLREGGKVLTVSETGYGRLSEISDYRLQSRGGKGTINYKTKLYGEVAAIRVLDEGDDIIIISTDGIVIRISSSSVRLCARPSKGVKVMRIGEGEKVATLSGAPSFDDADSTVIDELPEDDGEVDEDEGIEEEVDDDEVVEDEADDDIGEEAETEDN